MKTRNEVKERYRLETKREVNMLLGDDFSYTDKYVEWLEQMVVKNCSIPVVSSRYVVSNDRRPTQPGIYCVIDSHDQKASSYFDGKSWLIDTEDGEHPVKQWLEIV